MILKKTTILFIVILFSSNLIGQEKKQIIAYYNFINKNDEKIESVKLCFNELEARSDFYKIKFSKDTLYMDDYNNAHFKKEAKDSIGKQYYISKKNIIFRDHIYTQNKFVPVIVTENLPVLNWRLDSEFLKINNLECNKATLDFRGRRYYAWYTTKIPTRFGPWKFHGLPGLIVKIETDDKTISFDLVKLEYNTKEKIEKPSLGKPITFLEYKKFENKITEDFVEKLKTKLPRGATISVNKTESNNLEKDYD